MELQSQADDQHDRPEDFRTCHDGSSLSEYFSVYLEIVCFNNDFPLTLTILYVFSRIAIENLTLAISMPHSHYAPDVYADLPRAYPAPFCRANRQSIAGERLAIILIKCLPSFFALRPVSLLF